MRDPRSQTDPLDDPHNPPPWSLWEAFSETIVELASAAMTPTPTALAPEQSLPPPRRFIEAPPPSPPEPPQPTPGVPSPFASTAARHPYSTAFLMGAALTASCLLGAAGARAAFGQPVRSHAGSTLSRTVRRGSSNGCGGGGSGSSASSAVVTRLGSDVEARFSRLEEAVRAAQAGQARMAEQVQGMPQLAARIGSLQMKLDVDAKRLDRAMQGLTERKSNDDQVFEHVRSDIDSRVQQLGVELTAAADKARQSQKDMSASLARKMKEDMQQLLSRLDEVESSLGAVSAGLNRFKGHPVVNESVAPEIDTEPNLTRPAASTPDADAATAHVEVEQSTQAAVHHDDGNPDVDHVSATKPPPEAATANGVESSPVSVDHVQDPAMEAEKDSALLNATQGQFALPKETVKETVKDARAQDRAAEPVSSPADLASPASTGEPEYVTSTSTPTPEADQAPTASASAGEVDGAASTSAPTGESESDAETARASNTINARASNTINHPFDTTIKSAQPVKRLGINDTGEWKFSLEPDKEDAASGSGVRRKFVLLTRHAHKSSLGRYMPIWSMNMTFSIGPFATAVVFSPEVDMVLLDGAWWRCSREREIYTIREKVADDV